MSSILKKPLMMPNPVNWSVFFNGLLYGAIIIWLIVRTYRLLKRFSSDEVGSVKSLYYLGAWWVSTIGLGITYFYR